MVRARAVVLVAVAATCAALPVNAQIFGVSAEVVSGCALGGSQGGTLDFGVLEFGTHPATASGPIPASAALAGAAITLTCTADLVLDVVIDGGLHASGAQRRLAGSGSFVPYTLYADAGHTHEIPSAAPVPVTVPASGSLLLPVYGRATLSGNPLPAVYADTLNVTMSW